MILILVFFTSAGLNNINLTLTSKDNLNSSTLFSSENDHIDFKISIPEIEIENSYSPNGDEYQQLNLRGGGHLAETGKPRIPFKTVRILLPYGKDLKNIEVFSGEWYSLNGDFLIEPAQEQVPIGSNKQVEFNLDKDLYQTSEPFPNELDSVVGVYELRGYRILIVNLYPIKYFPAIGEISYVKEMLISINLVGSDNINTFHRNLVTDEKLVAKTIDNPEVLGSYRNNNIQKNLINPKLDLPSATYNYLIITNEALKNSAGAYTFQDLAAAKNASGLQTRIITVEYIYPNYPGNDEQEKIRNFIIDAYQTWGIEYVLLGGDGDRVNLGGESGDNIIPARGLYASAYGEVDFNITSDLYYAGLDGNWNDDEDLMWGEPGEDDLFAEVYVGRAPVDSEEELSNFVYKTLTHEVEIHPYLSDVLMVGEDLGWYVWGGDYKDEVKDGSTNNGYITAGFSPGYFVETLYDRDIYPLSWDKDDLMPLINDGIHIINHLGHCDVEYSMKMNNFDADSLTNTHYFFGYSQGCYNGAFDNIGPWGMVHANDSIVEHFVTTPHGAFAFIGNSRFGWGDPWGTNGASQYYDRQFFDAIFDEGIEEIGKANQDSKEDNIGFINQEAMRWVYYQLNLMGDPAATLPPQPNDFYPNLYDSNLTPTSGDQTTQFKFNVTYSDADNNPPVYLDVIINGTSFPMEKEDILDDTYIDGCTYQFLTYLQPGNYIYSFEGADYKFSVNTSLSFGPIVSEKTNENSSILSDSQVIPNKGIKDLDIFEYSVTYTDADNNQPEYINITSNFGIFSMIKKDYIDSNYMDGCTYMYETTISEIGTYTYAFECSDGTYTDSLGPYLGPEVYEMINYTMIAHNSYSWIDATSGVRCSMDGRDDAAQRFNLPFNFKFYNETFDFIYICTNGFISFEYETAYWSVPFPTDQFEYMIAPFWSDLISDSPCNIYVRNVTTPSCVVIEWLNFDSLYGPLVGTFEVILFESGEIIFNYDYLDYIPTYTCGLNFGLDTRFYNSYQNFTDSTDEFSILFHAKPNDFAPKLSAGNVIPKIGYQNTLYNFSVIYSDQDDNNPIKMDVIINTIRYSMSKVDFNDNNYTDGCLYQFYTYLPSSTLNYSYYFKCDDGKYSDIIDVRNDLNVSKTNSVGPSLINGGVSPETGYQDATIFTFMVTYIDFDNNAPEYLNVEINSQIFPMIKNNYLDSDFMDGCVYIYSTILNDSCIYTYNFSCSDGTYTANNGPYSGPSVESCSLFDGMYMNYLFTQGVYNFDSNISYAFNSGNFFKTTWDIMGMQGHWDINVKTRLMTNVVSPGFMSNSHTPFWIFTNVHVNDHMLISVDGEGDYDFIVTDEFGYNFSTFGNIRIWELRDAANPKTVAWYEQSTGILLNGTFHYYGGNYSYAFTLLDTNVLFKENKFPSEFELQTDAESPDDDGSFNLWWSDSQGVINYSLYRHSSYIYEIDEEVTLLIEETTDMLVPLSGYSNGIYYFIVVAHNSYGDTKSNCIEVTVDIPHPPEPFDLSSDADIPYDSDGAFNLFWTESNGANNYSLFIHTNYITVINESVILVVEETTDQELLLSGYSNGRYYFIVVAYNDLGETLSNCISVVILYDGGGGGIPGYELLFIIGTLAITIILLRNRISKKIKNIY